MISIAPYRECNAIVPVAIVPLSGGKWAQRLRHCTMNQVLL